ncbi:hypothetical protein GOBAR_DD36523 [Gossypium barbadense]|nr:hypothetical protein GOBAR_DD36523 [Gossypium barbadense]
MGWIPSPINGIISNSTFFSTPYVREAIQLGKEVKVPSSSVLFLLPMVKRLYSRPRRRVWSLAFHAAPPVSALAPSLTADSNVAISIASTGTQSSSDAQGKRKTHIGFRDNLTRTDDHLRVKMTLYYRASAQAQHKQRGKEATPFRIELLTIEMPAPTDQ